ncbi:MAG: PaaI family thioesterase [Ilumatobacteraceae bacterium]
MVHGGAIATALDSVVVPAVGQQYPPDARYSTVDMHVQYMAALVGEDAIAEGWVVRRGRTTVFCEAELVGATSGKVIARSLLTYNVSLPKGS